MNYNGISQEQIESRSKLLKARIQLRKLFDEKLSSKKVTWIQFCQASFEEHGSIQLNPTHQDIEIAFCNAWIMRIQKIETELCFQVSWVENLMKKE